MNLASNCRYPLWFPLLCQKWVCLSWSLSSLEWKSTASITVMFCSLSRCCQQSSVASYTFVLFVFQQDNDAPSHRARTPLISYSKKLQTSLVLIYGHQSAESVWMSYEQCRWAEAVPHWSLEQSAAERYWCVRQRLEKAIESMRACRWITFWTFIVSACDYQ